MAVQCLQSPIRLNGVVLNELSIGKYLPCRFTFPSYNLIVLCYELFFRCWTLQFSADLYVRCHLFTEEGSNSGLQRSIKRSLVKTYGIDARERRTLKRSLSNAGCYLDNCPTEFRKITKTLVRRVGIPPKFEPDTYSHRYKSEALPMEQTLLAGMKFLVLNCSAHLVKCLPTAYILPIQSRLHETDVKMTRNP
jgi:hypothetical protein